MLGLLGKGVHRGYRFGGMTVEAKSNGGPMRCLEALSAPHTCCCRGRLGNACSEASSYQEGGPTEGSAQVQHRQGW